MDLFFKYQGSRMCSFDNKQNILPGLIIGGLATALTAGATKLASSSYTNSTNKDIAEQNLQFQRENLEYQKALQQQIFQREDTAYQRTVDDMSRAGLNPLTMQGTDQAGEAIPTEALHNDFQYQSPLAEIDAMEMVNQVSNLYQQGIERDGLMLANKSQELDNQAKAIQNLIDMDKHGITIDDNGSMSMPSFEHKVQEHDTAEFDDKRSSANRNQREDTYQETFQTHDNSPREELLMTALENQLENNNPVEHVGKMGLGTLKSAYNVLKNPIAMATYLIANKTTSALKKVDKKDKKSKKSNRDWNNFGSGNW